MFSRVVLYGNNSRFFQIKLKSTLKRERIRIAACVRVHTHSFLGVQGRFAQEFHQPDSRTRLKPSVLLWENSIFQNFSKLSIFQKFQRVRLMSELDWNE